MSSLCLLKVEENKEMPISKQKNDYGGHIQTAITQKIAGLFKYNFAHSLRVQQKR